MAEQVRPRPWLRVISALAIGGLMIGLMIGRVLGPTLGDPRMLGAQEENGELVVRFDQPANVQAGRLEGALRLQVRASGKPAEGLMRLDGQPLRWRIEPQESELWITLIAPGTLAGTWDNEETQGEWRLRIHPQLRPEK